MNGGRKVIKVTAAILVAIFAMLITVTSAVEAATFTDMTSSRYDWVRPYVEKMNLAGVVKGTSENTFEPDAPVTREQLITMLVRLMGWEDEAFGKTLPDDFPKANSVAPWARSYVALAIEKGIIAGKDFEDFRPADSAKRFEVAIFAVKAIGLGQEAENRKNLSLILKFNDFSQIELDARPYIEMAVEKGIMKGFPDNSFKPDEKFTRAQMATVLHNLSKLVNAHNIIKGKVQDVSTDILPSIEIMMENDIKRLFTVSSETLIYKENERGALEKALIEDIEEGDIVNIITSSNITNSAVYVEISYGNDTATSKYRVEGTVEEIDLIESTLTIQTDSREKRLYNIKSNTKVYIGEAIGSLYELTEGQTVELEVTGDDIEVIYAEGINKVVEGIVRAVNLSTNAITIENEDTDSYETYLISPDVKVYRNDTLTNLYRLTIGDRATLTVEDSRVEQIEAESAEREITGIIVDISFVKNKTVITIEDEDGDLLEYEIDDDVYIKRNGKRADLSDLKNGDEVTVNLEYDEVTKIYAESVKMDISGTIKELTYQGSDTLVVLQDDSGKEYKIKITQDTKITKDRKRIEATDLRVNYYLDVEVENDEAVSIDVTIRNVKDTIIGTVDGINTEFNVVIVLENETKQIKHVYYTDDTEIFKDNRNTKISRIDEGDEVVCIGSYDGNMFVAETIHDITISD